MYGGVEIHTYTHTHLWGSAKPPEGGEDVFHLASIFLLPLSRPGVPSWRGSGLPRLPFTLKPTDQRGSVERKKGRKRHGRGRQGDVQGGQSKWDQ